MEEERHSHESDVYGIEAVKVAVESRIATAEIGGINAFNDDERTEWLDGIETCETLEIALSVYDYLDDFIRDGLAVVHEIQSQLDSNVLPNSRRQAFFERAQIVRFDDKCQLITEIEQAVDEARELQEKTLKILSDNALSVQERKTVIEKLNNEGASIKLVNMAEQIVRTARERLQGYQAVLQVESLLHQGEFKTARSALNASFNIIPFSEYARLEQSISQLQIKHSRLIIAA